MAEQNWYALTLLFGVSILLSEWIGLENISSAQDGKEVQKVAGRTLAEWGQELKSDNEFARLRAVKSLGAFGGLAVPPLASSLSDPSDAVQYWAADHLGRLNEFALKSKLKAEIEEKLRDLVKDPEKAVSLASSFALFQLTKEEAFLKNIQEKLKHSDRGMACSAAEFLGKIGPPAASALESLEMQFKQHKDYHVRGACQNAIRKIKEEPVQ